ncbi:MAG: hypothetical protein COB02_15080 [Candidatus Cloacimonadota bacterium]|nr:MAG: hypothetical protein COB02_15080 [Candidatus Cloacimonadota bacterium]
MSDNNDLFHELELLLSQKGLLSDEANSKVISNQNKKVKIPPPTISNQQGIEINISPDKYFAYLTITKSKKTLTVKDIHQSLKLLKINYGIDFEKVKTLVSQFNLDFQGIHSQKIASGKPVKEANHSHIEYYFEKINLIESKSKSPNYWDQFKLNQVKRTKVIAEKFGSFGGEDGITVTSQIIRALPKDDVLLQAGKNTALKNNQLISLIDGRPEIIDDFIHVIPKITIDSDFDSSQIKDYYDGDLEILGDIRPDNDIEASGNILVLGNVTDSQLKSDKSILINGKFSGENNGLIKAKETIYIDNSQSGTIESDESIYLLENLIDTNIYTFKSLYCYGKNSQVYGGILQVGLKLITRNLGTSSKKSTSVFMGNEQLIKTKVKLIQKQSDEKQIQINTLTDSISKIQSNFSLDNKSKKNLENLKILDQLIYGIKHLQKELVFILSQKQNLELQLQKNINSSLQIYENLHIGVQIQIQKEVKKVKQKQSNVEVYLDSQTKKIIIKKAQQLNEKKGIFGFLNIFK